MCMHLLHGFETGLKTLPTFRPDALAFFRRRPEHLVETVEASIRELPFLMPEPAEKPSLHSCFMVVYVTVQTVVMNTVA